MDDIEDSIVSFSFYRTHQFELKWKLFVKSITTKIAHVQMYRNERNQVIQNYSFMILESQKIYKENFPKIDTHSGNSKKIRLLSKH